MATKHWVRDVHIVADPYHEDPCYDANGQKINAMIFHFLRVCGWKWIWECDGERASGGGAASTLPNHLVNDWNMQESGVADWGVLGTAVLSKVTTPVKSGEQALRVVSAAQNDGVQSSNFIHMYQAFSGSNSGGLSAHIDGVAPNMRLRVDWGPERFDTLTRQIVIADAVNSGNNGTFDVEPNTFMDEDQIYFYNPSGVSENYTFNASTTEPYVVSIWAANDSGQAWNIDVDDGSGFSTLGTIPDNGGVYTEYHVIFTARPGKDADYPRRVRIVDPSVGGGNTIHIDSISVFQSRYEYYETTKRGVSGNLTNPDQFSTGGAEYSPGAGDVGSFLFVYDPVNNKNTGVYEITADVGGGVVQVDLRSGSAAFTTTTGLTWRIVDLLAYPDLGGYHLAYWNRSSGFGLESPHSSKWRFFMRGSTNGSYQAYLMWASPEDTDFDVGTGQFFTSGPSTQRNRCNQWSSTDGGSGNWTNSLLWRDGYCPAYAESRTWMMTDEDGSFFTMVSRNIKDVDDRSCFLFGYMGADPDHPGIEEFKCYSRWQNSNVNVSEIDWDNLEYRFSNKGVGFDRDEMAREACIAQEGIGTNNTTPQEWPAGANPWSGEEQLPRLICVRDPSGLDGAAGQQDSDIGVYHGRNNLPEWATFDSNKFMHFINGLVWEWMEESVLP